MAMLRKERGHVGNGLGDNGASLLEEWCLSAEGGDCLDLGDEKIFY